VENDIAAAATRSVHIKGVDRSKLRGSFIISAFAEVDGDMQAIGHEAVLSRWQVDGCANCMAHREASAVFALPPDARASADGTADGVDVQITTRHDLLRSRDQGAFAGGAAPGAPSYTVEPPTPSRSDNPAGQSRPAQTGVSAI
jgi:tyrosinase